MNGIYSQGPYPDLDGENEQPRSGKAACLAVQIRVPPRQPTSLNSLITAAGLTERASRLTWTR